MRWLLVFVIYFAFLFVAGGIAAFFLIGGAAVENISLNGFLFFGVASFLYGLIPVFLYSHLYVLMVDGRGRSIFVAVLLSCLIAFIFCLILMEGEALANNPVKAGVFVGYGCSSAGLTAVPSHLLCAEIFPSDLRTR